MAESAQGFISHQDISAQELVHKHMDRAATFVADEAVSMFRHVVPLAIRCQRITFDSPLEEIFYLWWRAVEHSHELLLDSFPQRLRPRITPHQQIAIGRDRYVIDFAICTDEPQFASIAVELDGHEFHERTRAQVKSRDRRDRALQRDGWSVMHFSFAEFEPEPLRCVMEVFNRAYDQIVAIIHAEPLTELA